MLIKSKFMKSAIVALAAGMVGSVAAPVANAAVDSNSYTIQPNSVYSKSSNQVGQNDGEDMSKATNDSNKVIVTNRDVTINGKTISKSEFKKALKSATFEDTNTVENSDPTFGVSLFVAPAAVAPLFIPGIGEAYITAAGTVVVAGAAVVAGTWLSNTVIAYFKAHRKDQTRSNYNKHTKPRPGRSTTKNRSKKGYKSRSNKRGR